MIGGLGNDVFVFGGTLDVTSGETVDGTSGTDTLLVTATTDLTGLVMANIDGVSIASGQTATFTGAQVTGQSWTVTGVAGGVEEVLAVNAAANATVNLSTIFTAVTNASIALNGAGGAETLTGSSAVDTISGLAGTDSVLGGGGADSLFAGADNDTLVGGAGSDTLSGGAGSDRFVFATGDASSTTLATLEVITDFLAAEDAIALGVTGVLWTGTALDYAAALTAATGVITGGTDIIAIDTGTNTFVFADTNDDDVLDTVIQLTGTGLGLSSGDFVV